MLRARSRTPSVTSVRMASGPFIIPPTQNLSTKQAELLLTAGRPEVFGRQHRSVHIQTKLRTMFLETAADHPGIRALALHARAEGGVVVLAAAHVANEFHHMRC